MIGLIGKKLGMTRRFDDDGRSVPVTVIEAGPCVITQVKTVVTDGYDAVQVGFGAKKPKNTPMPMQGHFRKAGTAPLRTVCEYRFEAEPEFELGQTLTVDQWFFLPIGQDLSFAFGKPGTLVGDPDHYLSIGYSDCDIDSGLWTGVFGGVFE